MAFNRITNLLNVSRQTSNLVFGNFSFMLFVGFLAILYVANAHFAEKQVRDIQKTKKEINELKWQYMSMKSNLMYRSMQSQIDTSLEQTGIDLSADGPKVIKVK